RWRRRRRRNRARSRSPARRCSAGACARCAPSRKCRSTTWRGNSWCPPDQPDEDLFERALPCLQVAEADAGAAEFAEQRRDAGALALRIIGVGQLVAVFRKGEAVEADFGR